MIYMDNFNDLLKKRNMPELVLIVLFIIYLAMGYETPEVIANLIDTPFGKVLVVLFALLLFAYSNPILGILGLLVAYKLIQSATSITGTAALEKYYPTEEKKWSPFTPAHQFPYTLEQEMVKKMASTDFNTTLVKTPYSPVMDDIHDASYLSEL
jgi:hypothetical protein